ncbi:hypothetical protein NKJ09_23195 [Mesorhizobium sp. M0189]|uniref:hypothetical protein n=1 Tax=Mesorhizobium sp. M0189 TaxID=2956909 RepID=UPI0033363546
MLQNLGPYQAAKHEHGREQTNSWADSRPDWLKKATGNRGKDSHPANNNVTNARANARRAVNQINATVHARRLE